MAKRIKGWEQLLFVGDILKDRKSDDELEVIKVEFFTSFGQAMCGYKLKPIPPAKRRRISEGELDPYFITQTPEDKTLSDLFSMSSYRLHIPSQEHLFNMKARVNNLDGK